MHSQEVDKKKLNNTLSPEEEKLRQQVSLELKDPKHPERDQKWAIKRYAELLTKSYSDKLTEQEEKIKNLGEKALSLTDKKTSDLKLPKVEQTKEQSIEKTTEKTKEKDQEVSLSFSKKIGIDSYKEYKVNAVLTAEGKLNVTDKISKTDLSSDFTVLYIDKNNNVTDKNGKIVKQLENDYGKVSIDYYVNKIDKNLLETTCLAVLEAGQLNNFKYNGKQVIFAKAPETKVVEEEKEKKLEEVVKQIPWSKVSYHEQVNGIWTEKNAFVRKSKDDDKKDILEIFQGRDSNGKEIWKDATKVNYPKLDLVFYSKSTGEFLDLKGSKITTFGTTSGSLLDNKTVKNLINPISDSIFGLKDNKLNNLTLNGKRPVFIEIP